MQISRVESIVCTAILKSYLYVLRQLTSFKCIFHVVKLLLRAQTRPEQLQAGEGACRGFSVLKSMFHCFAAVQHHDV